MILYYSRPFSNTQIRWNMMRPLIMRDYAIFSPADCLPKMRTKHFSFSKKTWKIQMEKMIVIIFKRYSMETKQLAGMNFSDYLALPIDYQFLWLKRYMKYRLFRKINKKTRESVSKRSLIAIQLLSLSSMKSNKRYPNQTKDSAWHIDFTANLVALLEHLSTETLYSFFFQKKVLHTRFIQSPPIPPLHGNAAVWSKSRLSTLCHLFTFSLFSFVVGKHTRSCNYIRLFVFKSSETSFKTHWIYAESEWINRMSRGEYKKANMYMWLIQYIFNERFRWLLSMVWRW